MYKAIERFRNNRVRICVILILLEANLFLLYERSEKQVIQINYSIDNKKTLIRNERMTLTFFIPGDNNYKVYEGHINDKGMEFLVDENIQEFDLCALNVYELNKGLKVSSIQYMINNGREITIEHEQLSDFIAAVEKCNFQIEENGIYFRQEQSEFGVQLNKSFINAIDGKKYDTNIKYILWILLKIIMYLFLLFQLFICIKKYGGMGTISYKKSIAFLKELVEQIRKNGIIILGSFMMLMFAVCIKPGINRDNFIVRDVQFYNQGDETQKIVINGSTSKILFPKHIFKTDSIDIFFLCEDSVNVDAIIGIIINKNGCEIAREKVSSRDIVPSQKITIRLENVDFKSEYSFRIIQNEEQRNSGVYLCGNENGEVTYSISYERYNREMIMLVCAIFVFIFMAFLVAFLKKIQEYRMVQQAIPFIVFVIAVWMIEVMVGNSNIKLKPFMANLIIAALIYNIIAVFVTKRKAVTIIYSSLCFLYGTISYFVLQIRGIPFLPQDIKSARVAVSVAKNYTYNVEIYYLLAVVLYICQIFTSIYCMKQKRFQRKISCIAMILLGIFLHSGIILDILNINVNSWNQQEGFKEYGHLASFYANILVNHVVKPEGYAKDEVTQFLHQYENTSGTAMDEQPNVIVVMNEAFSDLTVISDFKTNQEVMPYIDSLGNNAVKGNLFVSIVGGNTCNTEFEFLTGNTMAFLPENSVAFQNYINDSQESIVKEIQKYGYKCIGIHPYFGEGWNRSKVYPLIGIDDFYDISSFDENTEYIRSYVSDKSNYEKVLEYIEMEEDPVFLFNVTMQNHGGYNLSYNDFESTIKLIGMEGDYPQAEQYLSLINISDRSLEEFLKKIQNLNEKTIVCFFGDHQPFIENEFLAELYGKEEGERNEKEKQKRYCVPYLIISNFDLKTEDFPENISANYLGIKLLKAAGVEIDGYYKFLDVLSGVYPIINANGCMDNNGNWYEWDDVEKDEELSIYKKIQYGVLFDHVLQYREGK